MFKLAAMQTGFEGGSGLRNLKKEPLHAVQKEKEEKGERGGGGGGKLSTSSSSGPTVAIISH